MDIQKESFNVRRKLILKFGSNLLSLKASRSPLKIAVFSGLGLRKLCLKFVFNQLSLKASRTLFKINDIAAVVARVDEDNGHS